MASERFRLISRERPLRDCAYLFVMVTVAMLPIDVLLLLGVGLTACIVGCATQSSLGVTATAFAIGHACSEREKPGQLAPVVASAFLFLALAGPIRFAVFFAGLYGGGR